MFRLANYQGQRQTEQSEAYHVPTHHFQFIASAVERWLGACALGSILTLTADWMVHGLLDLRTYDAESRSFFDPFTFIFWRIIKGSTVR